MKKLKIGIIGVGRLGYEHACNIANRVPGSELVAIADANFDRAKQVAEELGVTAVYNDPKALCADPNVEAVAIIPILHSYFTFNLFSIIYIQVSKQNTNIIFSAKGQKVLGPFCPFAFHHIRQSCKEPQRALFRAPFGVMERPDFRQTDRTIFFIAA